MKRLEAEEGKKREGKDEEKTTAALGGMFVSMELELRHGVDAEEAKKAKVEGGGGEDECFTSPTPYPSITRPPQSPLVPPIKLGRFTSQSEQRVTVSKCILPPSPGSRPVIFGTLPPPSPDQLNFSQTTKTSLKTFGSEETKTIVVQTPVGTLQGEKTGVVYESLLHMCF